MKRLLGLTLLTGLLLVGPRLSEARVTTAGYSTTESSHTIFEHAEYEYYFNNSGAALSSGDVVVYDRAGTGINVPNSQVSSASRNSVDVDATDGNVDNYGTYITTSTTADDPLIAGVVDDDSCANQTYCRVQIFGPRLVRCLDGSDAVTTDVAVGTSTTATQCGGAAAGANGILGTALGAGSGFNNALIPIFIRPSTSDG